MKANSYFIGLAVLVLSTAGCMKEENGPKETTGDIHTYIAVAEQPGDTRSTVESGSNITTHKSYGGGIVGHLYRGSVEACYADNVLLTINVDTTSPTQSGGLAGEIDTNAELVASYAFRPRYSLNGNTPFGWGTVNSHDRSYHNISITYNSNCTANYYWHYTDGTADIVSYVDFYNNNYSTASTTWDKALAAMNAATTEYVWSGTYDKPELAPANP